MDELLSSVQREAGKTPEKDQWIEKAAGSYTSGKKDILAELFKGIAR